MTTSLPLNQNWTNEDGDHEGGVSTGVGFTIAWQRGPLNETGRNGAFLIEVLQCCLHQLEYFQDSKFKCPENESARGYLVGAIESLQSRRDRRQEEGTLGTTAVNPPSQDQGQGKTGPVNTPDQPYRDLNQPVMHDESGVVSDRRMLVGEDVVKPDQ